jgi:hypothetical protein
MTPLIEIVGKSLASPEAIEQLAKYPALRLDPEEAAVHDGADPVRYLRSEEDGLLIKLSSSKEILAIFLMSEGKDGFSQFEGRLPGNLSFSSSPSEALMTLGAPGYSRAAGKIGSIERGALLRFDRPGYSIHFQYRSGNGGIDLVTAMVASAVPGRSVR